MKKIVLFTLNFKGLWLSMLVLIVLMSSSTFFFLYTYGQYRYLTQTYDILYNSGLDNSVYFLKYFDFDSFGKNSFNESMQFIESVKKYPAVKDVIPIIGSYINYNQTSQSMIICNEELKKLYPELAKGKWFTESTNPDGSLNAVVGGYSLYNAKVGDILDMNIYGYEGTTKIKVCGVLNFPTFMPHFESGGSEVTAEHLFYDYDAVIVGESEVVNKLINDRAFGFNTDKNFFVDFKEDASQEDIDKCKEYLSKSGASIEMSKLLHDSKEYVDRELRAIMPRPIFLLVISFISYISVSILFVMKRIKERSVYYLLGYSKRKLITDLTLQIGILAFISGGINLLFVSNYSYLLANRIINLGNGVIFDNNTIFVILTTVLISFILALWVSLLILKKNSPLEVIKKAEE